jgi:cytochrome c553
VEVIVDGDMPRGGAKVSKEELALLSKWIDEGAKYDGQNATDSIKQLAMSASATPPAAAPMMAALKIVPATGKETTSYSRDVASVVAGACLNCHGMRQPRANLSLLTFERFLRGGDSGAMIVPGKPEESLLVKKLKGTGGGQQMPQGRPPLPDEAIAKIEKWIAEGAKYDGENPREETPRLVALYTAKHATHEELSEQRQELAKRNWLLAMPGETNKPTILETDDFLLYGSVGTERLQEVADAAQEQSAKVRQRIKAPGGKPLVKGRMTLFVFRDRYDYNEFGKMVEQRDIPKSWRGHWSYSITDAYGCLMLPNDDEYGLPALLAQLMAGTHVASRGVEIPRWLSEGSARAVAADLHPRDSRIKAWNDMLPTVVRGMRRPDAIIAGGLPPEESDLASYGFVRSLKPTSSNYQKMLAALESGAPIDVAFRQSFRATPAASSAAWVRGGGR